MSREIEVLILREPHAEGSAVGRVEVHGDRLTFESGDLVVWDQGQAVLRSPVLTVLVVALAPDADPAPAEPRRDRSSANTRWTAADEAQLRAFDAEGRSVESIARLLGRREGAIRARLTMMRRIEGHRLAAEDSSAEAEADVEGATGPGDAS